MRRVCDIVVPLVWTWNLKPFSLTVDWQSCIPPTCLVLSTYRVRTDGFREAPLSGPSHAAITTIKMIGLVVLTGYETHATVGTHLIFYEVPHLKCSKNHPKKGIFRGEKSRLKMTKIAMA